MVAPEKLEEVLAIAISSISSRIGYDIYSWVASLAT
jgi:hypothetical protein